MGKIVSFVKKESVLCISILAAVISMFIVRPDSGYAGYIDFRTLGNPVLPYGCCVRIPLNGNI